MKPFSAVPAIFLLALTGSSAAKAAEVRIRVMEEPVAISVNGSVFADFETDKDLGRAWVSLYTYDSITGGPVTLPQDSDNMRTELVAQARVPGLSYDEQREEIIYKDSGALRICDSDERCELTATVEERTVDDGFEPRTQQFAIVDLTIRD